MTIGLTFRVLPARTAGLIGVTAIVAAFVCGIPAPDRSVGEPSESRHVASSLWEYASVGRTFDRPSGSMSTRFRSSWCWSSPAFPA